MVAAIGRRVNANAVLAIVAVAQFMVVLDASVVNVALPSIQRDVGFSEQSLSWVLNAYTLIFGGFLLLGGRAADRLGRRRLFMAGIALFAGASLACGLSQSEATLLIARGAQGLGGAMVSPAALSIILTTFAEGTERNRALGVWGAIAGAGGAVGLLLGGAIVEVLSWRWVFFVNVPIGAAVLVLAPRILPESRAEGVRGGYDVEGATAITLGTMALVFTLIKANDWGWASARTLAGLAVSAALLVGFVWIERRHENPLVPLRIFSNRSLAASDGTMLLLAAALFGVFFFCTLYLQQVLGYNALKTGVAYLPLTLTAIVASGARLARGRPLHAQAGARRRAARRDGRLRAVHPPAGRRRLRRSRAARDGRDRRRAGHVVRADHDRRDERRRGRGLRPRLGSAQHDPAGRRVAGPGRSCRPSRRRGSRARWTADRRCPAALTHGFTGAFTVSAILCAVAAVLAIVAASRAAVASRRTSTSRPSRCRFARCPGAPYCGHLARVAAWGHRARLAVAHPRRERRRYSMRRGPADVTRAQRTDACACGRLAAPGVAASVARFHIHCRQLTNANGVVRIGSRRPPRGATRLSGGAARCGSLQRKRTTGFEPATFGLGRHKCQQIATRLSRTDRGFSAAAARAAALGAAPLCRFSSTQTATRRIGPRAPSKVRKRMSLVVIAQEA